MWKETAPNRFVDLSGLAVEIDRGRVVIAPESVAAFDEYYIALGVTDIDARGRIGLALVAEFCSGFKSLFGSRGRGRR